MVYFDHFLIHHAILRITSDHKDHKQMHQEKENRKAKHNQGFWLEVIGLISNIKVNRDLVRQL